MISRLGGVDNSNLKYVKTYYVSTTNRISWSDVRPICQSHGMDFVSLETLDEVGKFFTLFGSSPDASDNFYSVGGITSRAGTVDSYIWLNSGNRISYELPFASGEPNNLGGHENCLSIGRSAYNSSNFLFNDIDCTNSFIRFICQNECRCPITPTTTPMTVPSTSTSTTTSKINFTVIVKFLNNKNHLSAPTTSTTTTSKIRFILLELFNFYIMNIIYQHPKQRHQQRQQVRFA